MIPISTPKIKAHAGSFRKGIALSVYQFSIACRNLARAIRQRAALFLANIGGLG
jgi:hypothetical protein